MSRPLLEVADLIRSAGAAFLERCGPNVWTLTGSVIWRKPRSVPRLGGGNTMRVALTGHWGSAHHTNLQMPETNSRLGTEKGVRSRSGRTFYVVQFSGAGSL